VLDLFSGSGGLGIEAISRGAEKCVFVDSSKKAYDCILENLKHTKLSDYALVYLKNAEDFLNQNLEKFDIVFLDPPYSKGMEKNIFPKLLKVIKDNGIVVLETEVLVGEFDGFNLIKQVKYGRVYISVYKKGESK
jgi:16S rRNA (guanine(966)-N(2))-methyltransferase RsmD